MSKPKPVKVFQDVNGKYHENPVNCEIANLFHALDMDESENRDDVYKLLDSTIETGDKAKRLKKLLTGK